jgi:mycofactocin system creatininase family protein
VEQTKSGAVWRISIGVIVSRQSSESFGYSVGFVQLGTQAWTEVDETTQLLIPLGSTEQHGPHLPMDTDARIAEAIAVQAAEVTGATVAPVLPYGSSGEHAGFAGTLSIGTEALHTVIVELARSAALTFSAVTLVNGHGGNHQGVTAAVRQLVAEGHNVRAWSPSIRGGDAHAGRSETSLMLAIAPSLVHLDVAAAGNTSPLVDIIDDLRSGGLIAASPNGVLGDPAGASVEEGETVLAMLVADLVARLEVSSD